MRFAAQPVTDQPKPDPMRFFSLSCELGLDWVEFEFDFLKTYANPLYIYIFYYFEYICIYIYINKYGYIYILYTIMNIFLIFS